LITNAVRLSQAFDPEPDAAISRKQLKARHFQLLWNQSLMLKLVESYRSLWKLGALPTTKSSTAATNLLGIDCAFP